MFSLTFVFTIFFITLGPFKLVPAFYKLTQAMPAKDRNRLAWQGALIGTVIALFVALVVNSSRKSWGVSLPALTLTGGILLFMSSMQIISSSWTPEPVGEAKPIPTAAPPGAALSPVAIPGIITPYSITAILIVMAVAEGQNTIIGSLLVLVFVMLLNWLGMVFSGPIMRTIGGPPLHVFFWCLAVLQAALAMEAMLTPIRTLFGRVPG